MLLCGVLICAEPGATCKLCLETGKSCRRSKLDILVSLFFVFFFLEIAVAPLSSAEAPARFPSENSIKRAGDYGKTLPLFPSHHTPRAFVFPSPQSSCVKIRPLGRREVVAHSDFFSEIKGKFTRTADSLLTDMSFKGTPR